MAIRVNNADRRENTAERRRQVDNALLVSKIVFDTALSAMSIADCDGLITDANAMFLRIWGYAGRTDVIGKPIGHFLKSQADAKAIITALDQNGMWEGDFTAVRQDGSSFFVHSQALSLRDGQGKLIGYYSSVVDITDKRFNEEELGRALARYRAIVEDQSELICRYRPDGRLSFVNGAYARYYGKSVEDLAWVNFVPDIPEPDRTVVRELLAGITQRDPVVTLEHRVIIGSGEERWQSWTHRGIYLPGDILNEIQAVGRDITDRKRLEDSLKSVFFQLKHEEEKLRGILAAVGDMISIQDIDFKVTYQNEAHRALMGSHAGEFCYQAYEHQNQVCSGCPLGMTFRDGETHRSERALVIDGETRHFDIITSPLKDADGSITGGVEAVREITVLKNIEKEQHAALLHVARVGQLSEFVASLAHEISQPLSSILSYAQGAKLRLASPGTFKAPQLHQILQYIIDDDLRAGEIIRNLKMFLKKTDLGMKPLDVNLLIKESIKLVTTEAIIRKSSIALDLADGLPLVMGGGIQLQQVLLNLISNSFHAMAENHGPGEINISTSRRDADTILVKVKDSGTGISAENEGKIFNQFFTSKPDGLGMGLSIGRTIIEAHGGRLEGHNNPDRGATFSFTLPVNEEKNAL